MPAKAKKTANTTTPTATTAPETFETHKLPVPTWILRCPALHPWAQGLLAVRKPWLRTHQLPASLDTVVHEANTWLHACNNNLEYVLTSTDPDHFDYEDGGFFVSQLLNPPQALLDAAPGYARSQMKHGIRQYAPLSRLLTEEEKAVLVTEKDKAAQKKYFRSDPYGITDWIDGAGLFSSTDGLGSWVVWALEEVGKLLYLVAWCGRSLHESVPPELDPFSSHKWEEARTQDLRRVPLLAWVAQHEAFFGPATTTLFRQARAQVVIATLTSGLLPIPMNEEQEQELAVALQSSARISSSSKATGVKAGALVVFPALRDIVFGIPLLVQTIAEFA